MQTICKHTQKKYNIKQYKEYRNRVERLHYDKLLVDNKNNLKKTWSIIKDVINNRKQRSVANIFFHK